MKNIPEHTKYTRMLLRKKKKAEDMELHHEISRHTKKANNLKAILIILKCTYET